MSITRTFTFIILMAMSLLFVGCIRPKQVPVYYEIKPNETAFVVPLQGDTTEQGQFLNEDFVRESQVATKRIKVDTTWRPTGRFNQGYYMETAKVITVTLSPETREWTEKPTTGTSNKDDAFVAESSESIDFSYGGVLTARIPEDMAARFLSKYSGQTLAKVTDTNIRGYIQGQLAIKFGAMSIYDIRSDKGDVFNQVCDSAKEFFLEDGIEITTCGPSGGLNYTDPKVQDAITKNFEAQQEQIRSEALREAQEAKNQTLLSQVDAESKAEILRGEAEAEVLKLRGEMLAKYPEIIQFEEINRWNGTMPSTLVGDSSGIGMFLNSPE